MHRPPLCLRLRRTGVQAQASGSSTAVKRHKLPNYVRRRAQLARYQFQLVSPTAAAILLLTTSSVQPFHPQHKPLSFQELHDRSQVIQHAHKSIDLVHYIHYKQRIALKHPQTEQTSPLNNSANNFKMRASTLFTISALSAAVYAKTDLAGCTSSVIVEDGSRIVQWWVPETGEICSGLDCGGGRGPVKQDVPGCPAYTGTLEYEPSFLPGGGPNGFVNAPATPTGGNTPVPTTPLVIIGGPTLGGGAQVTQAPQSGSGNTNTGNQSDGSEDSDEPSSGENNDTQSDGSSDSDEEEIEVVGQNGSPITVGPEPTGFSTSLRSGDDEDNATASDDDDEDVATSTSSGLAAAATWPSMLTPVMGAMAMVAAIAI